jgi:hypothetical protein
MSCSDHDSIPFLDASTHVQCPSECTLKPGEEATHDVLATNLGPLTCVVSVSALCQGAHLGYGTRKDWTPGALWLKPSRRRPTPTVFPTKVSLLALADVTALPIVEQIEVSVTRSVLPAGPPEPLGPMHVSLRLET